MSYNNNIHDEAYKIKIDHGATQKIWAEEWNSKRISTYY